MAKKKKAEKQQASTTFGQSILNSLTSGEIATFLDLVLESLSPEQQTMILNQLSSDTQHTLQILLSPPQETKAKKASKKTAVSLAKQEETWFSLWNDWNDLVWDAADEKSDYMEQEADWEPPYFNNTRFIDDLEKIAEKMWPLCEIAFENNFSDHDFGESLGDTYDEVSSAMPEWAPLDDGFYLERYLTLCFLKWQWLSHCLEDPATAYPFVQSLRQWEEENSSIQLDSNTMIDFLCELSKEDQKAILTGLNNDKKTPLWQGELENTYSHWHIVYMHFIESYSPENYLKNLRPTIAQQWENGLPIVQNLIETQAYSEGLEIIQEMLDSILKHSHTAKPWDPKKSLFFVLVNRLFYYPDAKKNYRDLLGCYQTVVEKLEQPQMVAVLKLQRFGMGHFFDWETMFQAFRKAAIPKTNLHDLFQSWKDYIIETTTPRSWSFGRIDSKEVWWLHWLIDYAFEAKPNDLRFQKKVMIWLKKLPKAERLKNNDFQFLRLLMDDLHQMNSKYEVKYPLFFKVIVHPSHQDHSDDTSRREFLKQMLSEDLLKTILDYWKTHLLYEVPNPKMVEGSNYTSHAQWMSVLKELSPNDYQTLLATWRVDHKRRRNLWQAMLSAGLDSL